MSEPIWVVRCGLVPYEEAAELQSRLEAARRAGEVPDVLLLLEHPPVYSRGRRAEPAELPMGVEWYEMQGIEVRETDRGGRVTYHGPGQLVAYPILSLKPFADDVHAYVRRVERLMIESLAAHGVKAGTIDDLTGVWTPTQGAARPPLRVRAGGGFGQDEDLAHVLADVQSGAIRKIGSIGIHVSRGVTTHGLAVNVSNDLQPFEWIVPCGIDGCRMTSLSRELGSEQDPAEFATTLAATFAGVHDREPEELDLAGLDERLAVATVH
jgi:lipoyl(octanoyl) transferase